MTKKENWSNKNASGLRTDYRRSYQASPFYEFSNDAITTTSSWLIDIGEDKPEAKKHLPFSNVRIVNNSSENVVFFPNQRNEGVNIPSGTIISFDKMSIEGLNSLKFTNLGANTISANQLKITIWREGVEIDGAFQKMHKAFYEKFLYPRGSQSFI